METSSKTGALLSPDVSSASAHSRSEQKIVTKTTPEEIDIDAKTFEEAEANIKALVEDAEPKPKIKKEAEEFSAESDNVIETEDSLTEFVFLSSNQEEDVDVTECNNEVDPESVLDKIFDAAASGNSADFSRLLFNKTNKKQADHKQTEDLGLKGDRKTVKAKTVTPIVDQLLDKNTFSSRKRKAENNNVGSQKKNRARNNSAAKQKILDFKDIKNTTSQPEPKLSLQPDIEEDPKPDIPKLSLIDYSVLTNALTKTLQDNLNGGENDVKIVIFCNNKPIQSFSLKNNLGEVAAASTCDFDAPDSGTQTVYSSETGARDTCAPDTVAQAKYSRETNGPNLAAEVIPKKATGASNNTKLTSKPISPKLPTETKGPIVHDKKSSDPKLSSQSGIQTPRTETNSPNTTRTPRGPHVIKKKLRLIHQNVTGPILPDLTALAAESSVHNSPQGKLKKAFNISSKNKTNKNTSTFLRIRGPSVSTLQTGGEEKPSETTTDTELDNVDDKKSDSDDDDSNRLVINTEEELQTEDNKTTGPAEPVVKNNSVARFKCEFCDKSFRLRRTLNRHKLRDHAGPYPLPENTNRQSNSVSNGPASSATKTVHVPNSPAGLASKTVHVPNGPVVSTSSTVHVNHNGIGAASTTSLDALIVNSAKTKPDSEQKQLSDEVKVKLESSVEEIDISDIVDAEAVKDTENLHDLSYIQSILTKGPLYDIIQSKNTAQSTKVNTLRSVIQSVEKSKRLELPIDANGEVQPVFVCEHCGKYYRARKTLKDHFIREHAKELGEEPLYLYIAGNKYQCTICFHNFHSASELLTHTKTHTGELRSPCNICGKVYASVHVLRRHIDNVHSEVRPRPFRCQLCDYAASNKWHLKEHHRRHTGEQPFCCPVCNKSFSHQGTMNRHCKTIHRFDSSSLSREQLRLQQGLSQLTVPSLDLAGTELSLADLAEPEDTPDHTSDDSNSGIEIDMSIVKTEPVDEDTCPYVETSEVEDEADVKTELNVTEVDTSIVKMEPVESM